MVLGWHHGGVSVVYEDVFRVSFRDDVWSCSDGLGMVFEARLKAFRRVFGWVRKVTIYCRFLELEGQVEGQSGGTFLKKWRDKTEVCGIQEPWRG